jgi:hypothetical protein
MPVVLSVIMQNVIMLIVISPNVIKLSVVVTHWHRLAPSNAIVILKSKVHELKKKQQVSYFMSVDHTKYTLFYR